MTSIVTIGSSEAPYPMVSNVWEFFSEKATKTVFVSVGSGSSCLPDLDIAETLGCPLLKLDLPESASKWVEIQEILKTRKYNETMSEFAKPASRKWVLPKNLHIRTCVPSFGEGTLQIHSQPIETKSWTSLITEHCTSLGHPDVRVDLVKVEPMPFQEVILESLLLQGFRPSLLLVHWNEAPDTSVTTVSVAGHIQMMGYALIGKVENRFLYYYTDVNYYEMCSWERVARHFENPLMHTLLKGLYPGSENVKVQFPISE